MLFQTKYLAAMYAAWPAWASARVAGGLPPLAGVSYGKILHGQNQTLQFLISDADSR